MKKNHIVEILLTIVSLILLLIGFNTAIEEYLVLFDFKSFDVFVIDDATQNKPFPVYEHKNTKQTFNDNYAVGLPPAISPFATRRYAQHLGSASANTHTPSYSVNAKASESATINSGAAFEGMQAMAFQSTSKSNTTTNATRSFYSSSLKNDIGPSKVPFSSNEPNNVILADPKSDPLEGNRIPIGNGEFVLLILGLIYAVRIAKQFRPTMDK